MENKFMTEFDNFNPNLLQWLCEIYDTRLA